MLSSQHHSEPHVYQTNHTRYLFITCIHQTADDDALMHLDVHVRRDKSLYTSTCATGLSTTSLRGTVSSCGPEASPLKQCGETTCLSNKVSRKPFYECPGAKHDAMECDDVVDEMVLQ